MTTYRVVSLDVGQGMSTIVEGYSATGALEALALIDLGSTKSSTTAGRDAIAYVSGKAIERSNVIKAGDTNGYIDAVFVSHKDADHVNLLRKLLVALPSMCVGIGYYGGRYRWYGTQNLKNVIWMLRERAGSVDKIRGFVVGATSWNAKAKPNPTFENPLWNQSGIEAYALSVNTPHRDEKMGLAEDDMTNRPTEDQANSKSLVVALFISGHQFVIAGDATFETFAFQNQFFTAKFLANAMTLLPHHGSRKTTFGLTKTNSAISDENKKVVDTFAARMAGRTIVASADTQHGHPSMETIYTFARYTDSGPSWYTDTRLTTPGHLVTAFMDYDLTTNQTKYGGKDVPGKKDYFTFETIQNIYSTLYAFTIPTFSYAPYAALVTPVVKSGNVVAPGMTWIYTISAAGIVLTGQDSTRAPVAKAEIALAEIAPPRKSRVVFETTPTSVSAPRLPQTTNARQHMARRW
jgi:beta-lactamase superfamily II metal-dependent hydrolase